MNGLYRSVVCQVGLGMEKMLISRHFYQKTLYNPMESENINNKKTKNNIHGMTQKKHKINLNKYS